MFEKLLSFTMVLTRISAFFMLIPVFGWITIPVRIKVSLILLLSVFFSIITPPFLLSQVSREVSPDQGGDPKQVPFLAVILLIANEATYGFALGLIVTIIFSVVKLSGQIIEREMGLTMASILDPLTGEETEPLGSLIEMIFIILFLNANGHHLFLLIISRSYEVFTAGSSPTIAILASGVIKAGSAMFFAGLRLAAPMLAAFLLLLVILAVLARVVPEMDILFISLPLRAGLGLLMAAMFLPIINGFISEFADWMGKLLPL